MRGCFDAARRGERSGECDRDRMLGPRLERRRMKRTRTEDGHLLGNECNFIVNLSLSEGKQWYDLCTICPCNLSLLPPPPPPSPLCPSSLLLLVFFFVLSSSLRSPWPSSTSSSTFRWLRWSSRPPGELWPGLVSPRRVPCAGARTF